MTVNHLLQTLGIHNVPPVPPRKTVGGTENHLIKQSCTPCSPCSPKKQRGRDAEQKASQTASPWEMLADIARKLGADAHMLRALLSDDDMQAIADGDYSRELLAAYFKRMEQDGKPLVDPHWHLDHLLQQAATRRRQRAHNATEWDKAWRAAHEHFMNHLTTCPDCYAPRGRYCPTGQTVRGHYLAAYENKGDPRP